MGGYPPHGKGTVGVTGPGGAAYDGADPTEETRQEVRVHLDGDGKRGGRFSDDREIHLSKAEHSRAVHCYAISSGSF